MPVITVTLSNPNNPLPATLTVDVSTLAGPQTTVADYVNYYAGNNFTVTLYDVDGIPLVGGPLTIPPGGSMPVSSPLQLQPSQGQTIIYDPTVALGAGTDGQTVAPLVVGSPISPFAWVLIGLGLWFVFKKG